MTDVLPPDQPDTERGALTRRAVLAGGAAVGAILVFPSLACGGGSSDKSKLSDTSTTAAPTTTAPKTSTTAGAAPSGSAWPSGAKMTVNFTIAMSGGGMVRNPYVAVWVTTAAGAYVKTLSLWWKSGGEGARYLADVRAWYQATGGRDTTGSGPTRGAGQYSVVWDGTDSKGKAVSQGAYKVWIECVREKGPYGVTSKDVTIATSPFSTPMDPKGEITAATIDYKV